MPDVLEGQYLRDALAQDLQSKQRAARRPLPLHDGSNNQPSVGQAVANMLKRWVAPVTDDTERKSYGQPWQAADVAERVKDFLGRGETVLDLIARSGITLHEIRTLSKSELRDRIDAGAVRRKNEPRAPLVVVIDNGSK
jgi:hypothetical protein